LFLVISCRSPRTNDEEPKTKTMKSSQVTQLTQFLQDELTVSSPEIDLIIQKREELNALIPMLLWQYILVSRSGLERVFDWLEERY